MAHPFRSIAVFFKWMILLSLMWIAAFAVFAVILVQPTGKNAPATTKTVSSDRLRAHVQLLADENAPRNYLEMWNLDASAVYIGRQFKEAGGRVTEQKFHTEGESSSAEQVRRNTYRNVIASFGPEDGPRIIVGAHYDSCNETAGADDNASGVAGLIELARLLGTTELHHRIDLVAYTLEEPPFFGTSDMGSARHALSLKQEEIDVAGMIGLEMIGCFSDEPGSQHFPFPAPILRLFYSDQANYIGVVGGFHDRKLIRQMKASMLGATDLPVNAMCAPRNFSGIDLSDHRNYWANDYTAVMITDTAFYRNRRYHLSTDTPETLDYKRMSKVVLGVYEAVVQLANED